jgi:hypothetical protein
MIKILEDKTTAGVQEGTYQKPTFDSNDERRTPPDEGGDPSLLTAYPQAWHHSDHL